MDEWLHICPGYIANNKRKRKTTEGSDKQEKSTDMAISRARTRWYTINIHIKL